MARGFEPTDAERGAVAGLAAYGAAQDQICFELFAQRSNWAPARTSGPGVVKPISEDTLQRKFKAELAHGLGQANARVAKSLYDRAVNLKHPQGAISAMFWMKTRAGWKETQKIEHGGKVAWELPLDDATPEELAALERLLARQAAKLAPANDAAAA